MKPIIVCDLDGTLADVKHRRPLIENPAKHPKTGCPTCKGVSSKVCPTCRELGFDKWKAQWEKFDRLCIKDTPIVKTLILVKALQADIDAELWIATGRSAKYKTETKCWLKANHVVPDRLVMRPEDSLTPDWELKMRWVVSGSIPIDRIFCVFEDRQRVVDMWRDLNLHCYQVAEGNF